MQPTADAAFAPARKLLIVALLLIPIATFYFLLSRLALNLPFLDDYSSVLAFLNAHAQMPGLAARLGHLGAQHNEYRLIFENCIFVAQRALLGHANFVVLMAAGNLFVFLLFLAIWNAALPSVGFWQRVFLMLPVPFLLFQLQYVSMLDWGMCSLQHLPALAFALLSLWFLVQESRSSFAGACMMMLLCIAASGNGFLLVPLGCFILLRMRSWKRILFWGCIGSLALVAYLNHYSFHPNVASSPEAPAVAKGIHLAQLVYTLSFLGSSIADTTHVAPAVALGVLLLGGLFWCMLRRYDRLNPALFYFAIFLVMNAFAVSILRGGGPVTQSLASRYRIYSNLPVILSYLIALELWITGNPRARTRFLVAGVTAAAALFCAASDIAGFRYLQQRDIEIVREMAAWEHPGRAEAADPSTDPILLHHRAVGLYRPDPAVLEESVKLGVYQPPQLP